MEYKSVEVFSDRCHFPNDDTSVGFVRRSSIDHSTILPREAGSRNKSLGPRSCQDDGVEVGILSVSRTKPPRVYNCYNWLFLDTSV